MHTLSSNLTFSRIVKTSGSVLTVDDSSRMPQEDHLVGFCVLSDVLSVWKTGLELLIRTQEIHVQSYRCALHSISYK